MIDDLSAGRVGRLADDVVLHEDTILDANRLTRLLAGACASAYLRILRPRSTCGRRSLTLRPTPR